MIALKNEKINNCLVREKKRNIEKTRLKHFSLKLV